MLRKFSTILPAQLASIEQALGEGATDRVWPVAHTLRGSAGTLAAEPLQQAAERLEAAGRAADVAGCRAAYAVLCAAATDFQAAAAAAGLAKSA
jgi:HPt (histidine-containing phosphotransfer) domain-containing protein